MTEHVTHADYTHGNCNFNGNTTDSFITTMLPCTQQCPAVS